MKATFLHRENALCGFALEGHCGGVAGSDIVCAAVSSAAYLTANTITEVIGAKPTLEVEQDGKMRLLLSAAECERCRDILQGFLLHIEALGQDYPKQIQLIHSEV